MLSASAPAKFKITYSGSLAEAEAVASKSKFDVIICDLTLPDSSGLSTFRRLRSVAGLSAILVISGTEDEELATDAVREGAQDYLVKGQFDPAELRHAIRYAIERHRLQTALQQSEKHYRHLLEAITDYTYRVTVRDGKAFKTV